MLCENQWEKTFKDETGDHIQKLPCGKCEPCLINKQESRTSRLLLEYRNAKVVLFITGTYDDEHIPSTENGLYATVNRRDPQLFLKRLRKAGLDFTHQYTAEYGDTTYRPHYHFLLFFKEDNFSREIFQEKWPHGHLRVDIADINAIPLAQMYNKKATRSMTNRARYLCRHQAKIYPKDKYSTDGKNLPLKPFSGYSRRPMLGQWFIDALVNAVKKYPQIIKLADKDRSKDGFEIMQMFQQGFRMEKRIWPLDRVLRNKCIEKLGGDLAGNENRRLIEHLDDLSKSIDQKVDERVEESERLMRQRKKLDRNARQRARVVRTNKI